MHTLITLFVIWAAVISQEAPGPFFKLDIETDQSMEIAQVVVVDQQGGETVLTPEYSFDFKPSNVSCVWESARWVECLDLGSDDGPARVDYYLRPVEYRQFMPMLHSVTSGVSPEAPRQR